MAGRIQLKPHLTTEELGTRYRSCQKPQEKVRWHALYLISKGMVAADAARRVGRASSWITSLARRFNRDGAAAIARQKSAKPSHHAKVDAKLGKELDKALRTPAPDGGLWTAPKVAAWIREKTGQAVHHTTGWRALRRLGFSLQVPRPANKRRATLEEQAEFKKDRT
jgi:transposase